MYARPGLHRKGGAKEGGGGQTYNVSWVPRCTWVWGRGRKFRRPALVLDELLFLVQRRYDRWNHEDDLGVEVGRKKKAHTVYSLVHSLVALDDFILALASTIGVRRVGAIGFCAKRSQLS